MALAETLFIIGFLGVLVITFLKFYNVLSVGKFYDIKTVWLLFAGFLILYFVTQAGFLHSVASDTVYLSFYNLSTVLFVPNVLFLFIELFFYLQKTATNPINLKRNSLEERRGSSGR